jgi:hypothetical protein
MNRQNVMFLCVCLLSMCMYSGRGKWFHSLLMDDVYFLFLLENAEFDDRSCKSHVWRQILR